MDVANLQNRTGLHPGYGVYTPPHERKTTVPRMLYRGHAVRLSKGDEQDYYRQHLVRKYRMHSLNAGFSGKDGFPLKDQQKFKFPSQRTFCPTTPNGKWTNFPMTVEIGKYTRGLGGRVLTGPIVTPIREKPKTPVLPSRSRTSFSVAGSVDMPSRPLPSPLDFTSDARLYESLQPEIIDIMAARNEVFQSYQNRVESALLNDTDRAGGLTSNPVSRLGYVNLSDPLPSAKPRTPKQRPNTSFFVEDPNSNLLLPVPFIMPNNRLYRMPQKPRSYSAPLVIQNM